MTRLSRRDMLRASVTGTAVLTILSFLMTSGRLMSDELLTESTDDVFRAWFGIDEAMISRVMSELMASGADFADVYLQHTRSNSIRMEDGLISAASTGVDQGVGLRVVKGDQVGYAFTEDLTLDSMLGAARTAAAIAQGSQTAIPPQRYVLGKSPSFHSVNVPWDQVGIDAKLPLRNHTKAHTQSHDPADKKTNGFGT